MESFWVSDVASIHSGEEKEHLLSTYYSEPLCSMFLFMLLFTLHKKTKYNILILWEA